MEYVGKMGRKRRWWDGTYYIDCWRDGDGDVWFTIGMPDGDTWVETEDYDAPTLRDALSIAQQMINDDANAAFIRPDLYIGRGRWGERLYRVYGAIVAVYPTPDGIVWEGTYTDIYSASTVSSALDDAEEHFMAYEEEQGGE